MVRIELVDAMAYVEPAAQILRESWRQPCIHYTSHYLAWQLTYRSDSSPIAAMAFDGDRLIGQAIVIPRRMLVQNQSVDIFHLTFVCVLPEYRGQRIAVSIYHKLLDAIVERGWPVVAFTLHESLGHRTFFSALRDSEFHYKPLGDYSVHGYLLRPSVPGPVAPSITIANAESGDDCDYIDLIHGCADSRTLAIDADRETLMHWSRDPRRAVRLLAKRDGHLVGAVRIVRGQVVTLRGIEPVTSVEQMFLREADPVLLESLAYAAGSVWSDNITPEFVSFPNLGLLDETLVRAAQIRRTATKFLGHLVFPPRYDRRLFEAVDHTNMAVS